MSNLLTEIRDALRQNTATAFESLMDNEEICFLVDWREEDDAIIEYCEGILQTGQLSAEVVDTDNLLGFAVYISYGDKRVEVPLKGEVADRHITVHTLNQLVLPAYEIRYLTASNGSDTAAFVPLASDDWSVIEKEFPEAVKENFTQIEESVNLFQGD